MDNQCQNCQQLITANFCSNCGQKKYKRIDRKYLMDELQYSIIHTNKGFFYSMKNILQNPGKTAREFIDGNRVNHYKPILLTFVLSGVFAFVSFKLIGLNSIMEAYYAKLNLSSDLVGQLMAFLTSYNSIIMLLLIPFFSLISQFTFRKWGQNYYEHIVMNAYIQAFYTAICILLLSPILYVYRNNLTTFIMVINISMFIYPIILVWFYKNFYKDKPLTSIIFKVFWLLTFIFIGYVVLMFLLTMAIRWFGFL